MVHPYKIASYTNRARIMYASLLLFILFFGLRGNVGDNYVIYRQIYENLSLADIPKMPAFTLILVMSSFRALLRVSSMPY